MTTAETVGTFSQPRYEVIPTDDVYVGGEQVLGPQTSVIAEVTFRGTHLGAWRGLPATGRPVRYRMCQVPEFDGDQLTCERLYFDVLTVMRQVGIADDPTTLRGRLMAAGTHPVTVIRALVAD